MKQVLAALILLLLCPLLPAQIGITEFLASNDKVLADVDGDYSDWIELSNLGAATDLGGWYLTDDASNLTKWQFPLPTALNNSEYLVVFASNKDRAVAGQELHTNFKLKADGEYLALVQPDGVSVEYEYAPAFPTQYTDVSYGIVYDPGPTSDHSYFVSPTPWAANGLGEPVVDSVTHSPLQPNYGVDVTVVASLTPDSTTATLYWRGMYNPQNAITMHDDGLNGDAFAGDDLWTAIIPGGSAQAGEMLRWYVVVQNARGQIGRAPLFQDPQNSPEYFGTMVTDPLLSTPMQVLQWFVEDPQAAATITGTNCSLYFAGEFYDNVFVRIRGGSSLLWPKPNFKFDFHSGYHFQFDPQEGKIEEFNLNSSYSDKSYIRRLLAWETYAKAGADHCLAIPMRVQQNGSFYSVATFIEQPDEDLLKRNGLDEQGALYKMFNPGSSAVIDVEKKTRLHEDHSDLQAFLDGVAIASATRSDYLFDHSDLPAMVNYLAATSLVHDNDHLSKNHYLYRDSDGDGEWRFLAWDKDLTFGRNYTITGLVLNDEIWADVDPFSHPLFGDRYHRKVDNVWNIIIDAFYAEPRLQQMVMRRLRSLMDEQLQAPWTPLGNLLIEQRVAELQALMDADVALDYAFWGTGWGLPLDFQGGLDQLLNEFLPQRRSHLYTTHGPPSGGVIPIPQPEGIGIGFGDSDPNPISGNVLEEYQQLYNPYPLAIDLSNWSIAGHISMRFPYGTVLAGGDSIYLCRDLPTFRARASGPSAGQSMQAIGPYNGDLPMNASLQLFDQLGILVNTTTGPALVARNMVAGETALLQVVGANAADVVLFAYSTTGGGPTTTPYGLADLSMPINQLGTSTADALGTASYSSPLPVWATGVTVWTQALNLTTSSFTNNLVNTL